MQNPEQELRFTRAAQAVPLWLLAAVMGAAAITLLVTSYYRNVTPDLPHPMWSLLPLVPAWLSAKLAHRMTRHAYLILSPRGIEVFPVFRPQSGMRMIYWQEIDSMDANDALTGLSLHFNDEKTGGVHLSLRPIPKPKRDLLIRALEERLAKK